MSNRLPNTSDLSPFQLRRAVSDFLGVPIRCRHGETMTQAAMNGSSVVIAYSHVTIKRRRGAEVKSTAWRIQIWIPDQSGVYACVSDHEGDPTEIRCLSAHVAADQEAVDHARHIALGRPYRGGYRTPVPAGV